MLQLDAISAAEKHHHGNVCDSDRHFLLSISATVYHAHHHETLNAAQSLFISRVAISVALVFEFFKVIDA